MDNQPFIPDLFLDLSALDQSFFLFEDDPAKIDQVSHNDAINDWLIEHARRFNQTAKCLDHAYFEMQSYGNALIVSDSAQLDPCIWEKHRYACRNVCFEIDTFIEAYKSFLRYYFFMDTRATDDGKKWYKALCNYKSIQGWDYIESVLNLCVGFIKEPRVIFIQEVRNREAHNESPIELMNYKYKDDSLEPIPESYVLSNHDLHNTLIDIVNNLKQMTAALQIMLEHVNPVDIYDYLMANKNLPYLIKPADRYKQEALYVQGFKDLFAAISN